MRGGVSTDRRLDSSFASVIRMTRASPGVIVWDSALPGDAATPASILAAQELARELVDHGPRELRSGLIDVEARDVALVSTAHLRDPDDEDFGCATVLLREPALHQALGPTDAGAVTTLPDGSQVMLLRLDGDDGFLPRLRASGYELDDLTLVLTSGGGSDGEPVGHLAAATRLVERAAEWPTSGFLPDTLDRRSPSGAVESGVVVIVPAHNEAEGILEAIASLRRQTLRPQHIVVVSDNSTDPTPALVLEYQADDVELIRTVNNSSRKSGALNAGLRHICQDGEIPEGSIKFIVTMDADTDLEEHFLETAVGLMTRNPSIGGLCASCLGKPGVDGENLWQRWVMWFQRVEHARYTYTRVRTDIHTMSGAGSLYRAEALNDLLRDRGCVFDERPSNLVEDYETTLAMRDAGWTCTTNGHCLAYTDLMPTVGALIPQRQRWVRGTVDELRRRGRPDEHTRLSVFQIAFGVISLPWVYLWLAYAVYGALSSGHVEMIWVLFAAAVAAWQAWSIRSMGVTSMLVATALVPELLF